MAQGSLSIQTTGVLSGLALVNAINDALDNLTSNASGSTDPSTLSGGVKAYSFWLDSSVSPNILRMRNSANTAWAALGTITGTNFVPNLENADISTALGYTPANLAGDVFTGNVSSTTKFIAPILEATTKYVFPDGSEQTTAAVTAAAAFPSGTIMLFAQTSAPTGWTKSTAHNNKSLRVVSGTAGSGGSIDFTTAFANRTVTISGSIANHTLTLDQIPTHAHGLKFLGSQGGVFAGVFNEKIWNYAGNAQTDSASSPIANSGGGQAHTHGWSGNSALNMAVQYVDIILAIKN